MKIWGLFLSNKRRDTIKDTEMNQESRFATQKIIEDVRHVRHKLGTNDQSNL